MTPMTPAHFARWMGSFDRRIVALADKAREAELYEEPERAARLYAAMDDAAAHQRFARERWDSGTRYF